MENKHQVMGTEKITKLLLQFSLPATIGMLVNALYNIVDRIYIGNIKNVGGLAMTGVTVTFPVVIFVFAFSIMIGLGNASNVSLCLGRKEKDEAEKYLGTAIVLGMLVSLVLMLVILYNLEKIVYLQGADKKSAIYAIDYLKIVSFGIPGAMVGYIANASIRSDGNAKIAMGTLIIGAVINIILDTVFVIYLQMGVSGAAWATVISQYISGIWAVYYFISKFSILKIKVENLKLCYKKIIKIVSLGSAPFAIQMGAMLVNSTYNNTLEGNTAIGAMGIVQAVIMFVTMPIFGINQGLQPILGYNYAAKLYKRVKEALFRGIFIATIICIVNMILIQLFSVEITSIFVRDNPELLNIASNGLKIQLLALPIIGFQIISSIYFQAIGKPKMSLFMGLTRQLIILIPCILILSRYGEKEIWFAAPISDTLASILTFIFIKLELKHLTELENNDI